jgi:hypothetical protein
MGWRGGARIRASIPSSGRDLPALNGPWCMTAAPTPLATIDRETRRSAKRTARGNRRKDVGMGRAGGGRSRRGSSCRPDEAWEGGGGAVAAAAVAAVAAHEPRVARSTSGLCWKEMKNLGKERGCCRQNRWTGKPSKIWSVNGFYLMLFTVAEPVLSTQDYHHAHAGLSPRRIDPCVVQ